MNSHDSFKNRIDNKKSFSCRPLALAIALTFAGTIPNITQAATYTVTNTNDTGIGSLRRAIQLANGSAGKDTINFSIASASVIALGSELSITDSVTISGPTAGDPKSITLYAGANSRHFNASSYASLTLENMRLRNGNPTSGRGGSIYIELADLTLNNTIISGNSTTSAGSDGGAISVLFGNLILNDSIVSGNSTSGNGASGGAIHTYNSGVFVTDSTISDNTTSGDNARGGAVSLVSYNQNSNSVFTRSTVSGNSTSGESSKGGGLDLIGFGSVTLNQSTISKNFTEGVFANGGGIASSIDTLTINQSTLSGNSTKYGVTTGGGMFLQGTDAYLNQSTVTKNSSGNYSGGIFLNTFSPSVTLTNSILSGNYGINGNIDKYDSSASIIVNDSLFGDPLSEINTNNNAYYDPSNNPLLGPLQHNGGFTQTHKPTPTITSLIIDSASNTNAAAFTDDQRGSGFPRIHNSFVDMGAVELQKISGNLNPNEVVTRRDMARELLKVKFGLNYSPPEINGLELDDINVGDINARMIIDFLIKGYTAGCSTNSFCSDGVVTREEIAKIFLKVKNGSAFTPSPTTNNFSDAPVGSFNADWITELRDGGFTQGCDTNKFCPKEPVTREWFDYLLTQL